MRITMQTILFITVTIMLIGDTSVEGQVRCNPFTGPAGNADCVKFDSYDAPQWAVCLSNDYIQLKSKHRHICREFFGSRPDYCWYQCQIETFHLENGPVFKQCHCTPGDSPPEVPPIPDIQGGDGSLPEWCLSPSGTECTWYSDCLLKRHPCRASATSYALSYAEKFCNVYKKHYRYPAGLTSQGKEWVDAVRKCLQVALVPYIRPWSEPTCTDLKEIAFDSHTSCYLEPFPEAPSICDLDCKDWAQIFWTIKDGFTQTFVEPLQGALDVILGHCNKSFTLMTAECPTTTIRLNLDRKHFGIEKRSTNQGLVLNNLAGSVADQLATKLKWSKVSRGWYAYAPNSTTNREKDSDITEVEMLLGDKVALGLTYAGARYASRLEIRIKELSDAVEGGAFHDMVIGNEKVTVRSMVACQDMKCEETFLNVTAGPPNPDYFDDPDDQEDPDDQDVNHRPPKTEGKYTNPANDILDFWWVGTSLCNNPA